MQIPPSVRPQGTQRFYTVSHKIKTIETEITEKTSAETTYKSLKSFQRVPHNGIGRLRNHLGGVSVVLYHLVLCETYNLYASQKTTTLTYRETNTKRYS